MNKHIIVFNRETNKASDVVMVAGFDRTVDLVSKNLSDSKVLNEVCIYMIVGD